MQILRGTVRPAYLAIPYFKERDDAGEIVHREMHMPTAYETLAEAAILEACSEKASVPDRSVCFSYWPTANDDSSGYFEPYMFGLKARQSAVAEAIRLDENSRVTYLDIKKFYPSISCDIALKSWREFCEEWDIGKTPFLAGQKIIDNHRQTSNGHMLTGPMFSHFIGNLVLRNVDDECCSRGSKIFRYVDDFLIVGDKHIDADVQWLRERLKGLGFETHGPASDKSITVMGSDWLESARDFESGEISRGWMKLVGDIKRLLLLKPDEGEELLSVLRENGFRLPIRAYQSAVREASTFERVRQLGLWRWLLAKTIRVSIGTIVRDANTLREKIEGQIEMFLRMAEPGSPFERKRRVTKLRYRIGRALYLSDESFLREVMINGAQWPELEVHFSIIDALISRRGDTVIAMGTNVSQAAAQLFAASDTAASFEQKIESRSQQAGLAIFISNGVSVNVRSVLDSPLLQFATGPITTELFTKFTGFLRDAACLHGVGEVRHSEIMRKAYDVAEEVHFDAISLDYGYSF